MKKIGLFVLAAAAAHVAAAGGISAQNAWARPTVEGMRHGGVFVELENRSGRDDVLIAGGSPAAARVEIHEHVRVRDVVRMREAAGGAVLPQGKQTVLRPGGHHIMLIGLKQPLAEGSRFPLTLEFKHAPAQTVEVEVKNAAYLPAHAH